MKARLSFISNSSSSSFIAFIEKDEYEKLLSLIQNEKLIDYMNNKLVNDISFESYLKELNIVYEDKYNCEIYKNNYNDLKKDLSEDCIMIKDINTDFLEDNSDLFGNHTLLQTVLSFIDETKYNIHMNG